MRAVVLGAGGAARAIVTELVLAGAADVLVANRSIARGEQMVAELARKTKGPIRVEASRETYRVPPGTDLLVNATSVGLYPDVTAMPPVHLSDALSDAAAHLLVADGVPNPPETALLKMAKRQGLRVLACYLAYAAASNSLLLVDDAGDAAGPFAGGMVLTAARARFKTANARRAEWDRRR